MSFKTPLIAHLFLVIFFIPLSVQALTLSAKDIMLNNEKMRKSVNEVSHLKMVLTNKSNKQRTRSVQWIADDSDPINRKSLVRFLSPRDIKNTGLLTIENDLNNDDRWLYLPALRKIRRISATDKTDSFMGTDFSYEDFEILDGVNGSKKRQYQLLKEELKNGTDCYVIEAITTDPIELEISAYSKRHIWIRKDNFVKTYETFYDQSDNLIKILDQQDIHLVNGSETIWRSHQFEMTTLKTGHKTTLIFDQLLIDQPLAENTFTKRFLQRGR